MKLLFENWRKFINEAAKTSADLPDSVVITIQPDRSYMAGPAYKIFYARADKPEEYAHLQVDQVQGGINLVSLDSEYGPCEGAMMVGSVSAEPTGWGPLLYDVAIEWATIKGNGLISDREGVSLDARKVWDYYLNNRGDVTANQLDDLDNTLTPEEEDNCDQYIAGPMRAKMYGGDPRFEDIEGQWQDSSLSKRFTKEPTTINSLGDRLVIIE